MASPHATGVAAVIISEFSKRDRRRRGIELRPETTERILRQTAREHACPEPMPTEFGPSVRADGFYGFGIVDALRAATAESEDDDD
jgi:lantibiotic leader peptide-processing serine protease